MKQAPLDWPIEQKQHRTYPSIAHGPTRLNPKWIVISPPRLEPKVVRRDESGQKRRKKSRKKALGHARVYILSSYHHIDTLSLHLKPFSSL